LAFESKRPSAQCLKTPEKKKKRGISVGIPLTTARGANGRSGIRRILSELWGKGKGYGGLPNEIFSHKEDVAVIKRALNRRHFMF